MGGRHPGEGEKGAPGSGPDPCTLAIIISASASTDLSVEPTQLSRLYSLTGEGAALTASLRVLGCLTYIPPRGGAECSSSPGGEQGCPRRPRRNGLITGIHPASHQPPSPSQPECLLKTQIRSFHSLRKTFQGLPVELSMKSMPSHSSKIPHDAPLPGRLQPICLFSSNYAPALYPFAPSAGPLHLLFSLLVVAASQRRLLLVTQVSI